MSASTPCRSRPRRRSRRTAPRPRRARRCCTHASAPRPPRSHPRCSRTNRSSCRSITRERHGGRSREPPVEREVLRGGRVPRQLAARARPRPPAHAAVPPGSPTASRDGLVSASTSPAGTTAPGTVTCESARRARRRRRRPPGRPRRAPVAARRLVELGAVREDRDRRFRERPVELRLRQEPSRHRRVRRITQSVERHRGVAGHEQPWSPIRLVDLDRVRRVLCTAGSL